MAGRRFLCTTTRRSIESGPSFSHFLQRSSSSPGAAPLPAAVPGMGPQRGSYFLKTYGCQMNVSDSQVVDAVLQGAGYRPSESAAGADVVLLNTCAIREGAENKVIQRLHALRHDEETKHATVGVLGCMAERLKDNLLDSTKLADLVAGPDAYRRLPDLLRVAEGGERAIDVQLSVEETYADVAPVRAAGNQVSAFVSITRGCNNMCTYCIVPFTRGRERSRSSASIVEEVRQLSRDGFREVTLPVFSEEEFSYFKIHISFS